MSRQALARILVFSQRALSTPHKDHVTRKLVQKTVSVTIGERLLLYTGVGTGSLTRWHLRDIAAALALPFRTIKRCTINSSVHTSVEAFAMQHEWHSCRFF